jgi:hypothetical protein
MGFLRLGSELLSLGCAGIAVTPIWCTHAFAKFFWEYIRVSEGSEFANPAALRIPNDFVLKAEAMFLHALRARLQFELSNHNGTVITAIGRDALWGIRWDWAMNASVNNLTKAEAWFWQRGTPCCPM